MADIKFCDFAWCLRISAISISKPRNYQIKYPRNQIPAKFEILFLLIFYQSLILVPVYRISLLIIITLINNRKINIRPWFFVSTEIVKLNTYEMFCNHQLEKLNTRKMYFFSKCGIKQPRNLKPLKYKSFLFSDLYIYSFCYDKDLLCNHGVIKLHDIIQSKKKKKDLAKVFFTQKWTFFYWQKFSCKISPRSHHSWRLVSKFFAFFPSPKKLLHAKISALKLCSGIITKFHF